jgi:hypothetical protein
VPGWSTEAELPPGAGLLALRMAPILGIIIVLPEEERRHEPEVSRRRRLISNPHRQAPRRRNSRRVKESRGHHAMAVLMRRISL